MKQFNNLRVAFVYDRVNKFGGAERVLLALHQIWPSAPLYTSVYDPAGAPWAKTFKVIPSFVNKLPLAKTNHEIYPWLMPLAFEQFNFDNYDVVISVTSAEAKGIITKPETLHLCYCLTPTRYLWSGYKHYLKNPRYGWFNPLVRLLMKPMLKQLQKWDKIAAQRPDDYFAISKTVKTRIKKYYHRNSEIIYPPVDVNKFKVQSSKFKVTVKNSKFSEEKGYFLVVSRLVSYKRIDIIVDAFNQLGLALKIIGEGTERKYLESKARKNIEFLGQRLTDRELISYYQNCSALVFTAEEDLGLVSLEAQACGKPVIAYKMGGVSETVVNDKTGLLFNSQTVAGVIQAVKNFKPEKFKPKDCCQQAEKFSQAIFIKKFKNFVEAHQKLTHSGG
jgi:glycosyltransferase involved in cell wall biosynthesis